MFKKNPLNPLKMVQKQYLQMEKTSNRRQCLLGVPVSVAESVRHSWRGTLQRDQKNMGFCKYRGNEMTGKRVI